MPKPTLSDTARAVLTAAAERADHIALPPERLPAAAQRAVVQSLLKAGVLEEVAADHDQPSWRSGDDGSRYVLRITEAGLLAVGREPDAEDDRPRHEQNGVPEERIYGATDEDNGGLHPVPGTMGQGGPQEAELGAAAPATPAPATAAQDAPTATAPATSRTTLRDAAQALLTAWDADGRPALPDAVAALRTALAGRQPRAPAAPRPPRTDTKQAMVLALLRRPEGTTIAQVVQATGWAPHTVRGFFAGLKKRQGIAVEVLDRVRQIGPGKQGAKGSFSIYRVAPVAG